MLNRPRVIDLFAGVGGLSLGAARAGFEVVGCVELDDLAITTHAENFPRSRHLHADVSTLTGASMLHQLELQGTNVDGLIGGPPCQGFSDMGRREATDPRNSLLSDFFRLVGDLRPAFFVAENVPGVLATRNQAPLERALDHIPGQYVRLRPVFVKASDHGAPTTRSRVFFIGYDPSRWGTVREEDFVPRGDGQDVRVRHALEGLPNVSEAWSTAEQGWQETAPLMPSRYAERMEGDVPEGVGNEFALDVFRQHRFVSGFLGTVHRPETIRRFSALQPGETDPVSKGIRLSSDGYCPTLRAGTGPDRGSYQAVRPIHPRAPRVISPREAARLQGFPDWFQFHHTKWHAFRQIGNSVSPVVGEAVLRVIRAAGPRQ